MTVPRKLKPWLPPPNFQAQFTGELPGKLYILLQCAAHGYWVTSATFQDIRNVKEAMYVREQFPHQKFRTLIHVLGKEEAGDCYD